MRTIVILGLLILSACSMSPSADVISALAKDPATVKIDVTSPWGSFHLDRSNPAAAQVPVQIVPVTGAATVTVPPVK